jgi:hypothetical protein
MMGHLPLLHTLLCFPTYISHSISVLQTDFFRDQLLIAAM